MLAKTLVVALLLGILVSLFSGMYFLVKDTGPSKRTVRALTMRVALSLTLIIFLIIAAGLGWIHPHSLAH